MNPPKLTERARQLRQTATPAEQKLWRHLRNRQLNGLKFRRQTPLGPFIADFYCHAHKLVIELDGDHHAQPQQAQHDAARTEWLAEQGIRVIRFGNREIEQNLTGVLQAIAGLCEQREG